MNSRETKLHRMREQRVALLQDMVAVVQCKYGDKGGWEGIASFNVEGIAKDYAKFCKVGHPQHGYRVVNLHSKRKV